jgi:Fe-Mn family superoxide dismutase
MEHQLPALPYAKDALAPHMSAETFDYHYASTIRPTSPT